MVCTANICRSPVIASLLSARLGPEVELESRGTRAIPGAGMCEVSTTWAIAHGIGGIRHASRQLTVADVRASTVILTATRRHRAAVIELRPSAQVRTFTLAQAARISTWLRARGACPPAGDTSDRLLWLAEEMDAARGMAPRPERDEDDDLPDPHYGVDHSAVHDRIVSAADGLASGLRPGRVPGR